jgi:hypothetical protein
METHNAHLSAKVANELEVMMRLAHPNIVQALHIALWQRPAADSTLLSATHDAAGFDLGVGDISDTTTVTFTNSSSFCVGSQGSSTQGGRRRSSSLQEAPAADPCLQRGLLSDRAGGRDQAGAAAEANTSSGSTDTLSSSSIAHGVDHAAQAACPRHGTGWVGQLEESRAWLVLELCDGGTLEEAIQAGRYMKQDGQPDMVRAQNAAGCPAVQCSCQQHHMVCVVDWCMAGRAARGSMCVACISAWGLLQHPCTMQVVSNADPPRPPWCAAACSSCC